MQQRTAILVAMTFLALSAMPGCTNSKQNASGSGKSPIRQFLMTLEHYEPGVISFQDLMIVTGSYPARSDPHVAVEVSREEAEAVMAALDKCQAMTRQDSLPPGVPWRGWTLRVSLLRDDGTKVQGYWHFGREIDINLPVDKRDILQAAREALSGRAREQVDGYFAAVAKRADAVAKAVEAGSAPKMEFKVQSHWAHGRIALYIIGEDAGLVIGWSLPPQMTGRFQESIVPGEVGPSVCLFHVNDIPKYPIGGAVRPPKKHETALAGQLICGPERTDKPMVSISLRNLRFPTLQIENIGPIEVQLDLPAPPP